jgi:FkbM family methyltransferase
MVDLEDKRFSGNFLGYAQKSCTLSICITTKKGTLMIKLPAHPDQGTPLQHPLLEHLRWILQRAEIDHVLDIGANVGEYGHDLRTLGYTGTIHSFEPIPEVYHTLEAAAKGDDRWCTHQQAFGANHEKKDFHVAQGSKLSSFLHSNSYGQEEIPVMQLQRIEKVLVKRLESWSTQLPLYSRIFLKIDTQGYDMEVLRGAESFLPRVIALQTELAVSPIYQGAPSFEEHLEFISAAGFALAGLFPVTYDRHFRVIEFDCLALRAESIQPLSGPFQPQWQI